LPGCKRYWANCGWSDSNLERLWSIAAPKR